MLRIDHPQEGAEAVSAFKEACYATASAGEALEDELTMHLRRLAPFERDELLAIEEKRAARRLDLIGVLRIPYWLSSQDGGERD